MTADLLTVEPDRGIGVDALEHQKNALIGTMRRNGNGLSVPCRAVARALVKLRHPGWCRQLSVRLNGGKLIDSDQAGRYVELARTWRDGDVIDIDLPMHVHLAPLLPFHKIANGYYNLYWRIG